MNRAARRTSLDQPDGSEPPAPGPQVLALGQETIIPPRPSSHPPRHGRPCAGHPDRTSAALQANVITGTSPVMTLVIARAERIA
ncbi:hypothetical protein J4G37_16450 [Microvirga sp. 3-52]|nr:hypothetical protein [Microvirga sp. 3-52]